MASSRLLGTTTNDRRGPLARQSRHEPSGHEAVLLIGIFEPDLTRVAMIEQHPMAWLVELAGGFIVDARTVPPDLQDEALRRGLIPDLDALRAA